MRVNPHAVVRGAREGRGTGVVARRPRGESTSAAARAGAGLAVLAHGGGRVALWVPLEVSMSE